MCQTAAVHPHLALLNDAPSWTVLAVTATLVALMVGFRAATALPPGLRGELAVVVVAGGWLCAKVGHVVFESRGHALPDGGNADGVWTLLNADPWHWARLFEPGFVQLAGVFGAVVLGLLFLTRAGVWSAVPAVADAAAVATATGLGIGRVGCFLAGCCHGAPSALPWAVHFPESHVSGGVAVHPTQLYDVGAAVIAVIVWRLVHGRQRQPGTAAIATTATMLLGRFITEFARGDADRGLWGPLSTSQWLALAGMLILAGLLWRPSPTSTATVNPADDDDG
jgi:prolipoprotein diacylglyceryltransferase